jgi:hypothetical protein
MSKACWSSTCRWVHDDADGHADAAVLFLAILNWLTSAVNASTSPVTSPSEVGVSAVRVPVVMPPARDWGWVGPADGACGVKTVARAVYPVPMG